MQMRYVPLPVITDKAQAEQIMKNGTYEDLMRLPLAAGEYFSDWKAAQDLCPELAENEDAAVRANAVLGLAYTARTKGMPEKHLAKPVILRELRENTENRRRIEDAAEDINYYLKWNMAYKSLRKDQ